MTLAQLRGWARLHQRRRRHDQRDLLILIRNAMAADAADLDRMFAPPSSNADLARAEAETLAAFTAMEPQINGQ